MDLTNHFGIDVARQFADWFDGEFAERFAKRFPDKTMTLIVLDPDQLISSCLHWEDPKKHIVLDGYLGSWEGVMKAGGTWENVLGKLRYVLRTMENSVEAETDYINLRPGDFPWEGAGEYKGFTGGVSGLAKEEDWEIFCFCVDKLFELITRVGQAAAIKTEQLRKAPDADPRAKYLRVKLTEEEVESLLAVTA